MSEPTIQQMLDEAAYYDANAGEYQRLLANIKSTLATIVVDGNAEFIAATKEWNAFRAKSPIGKIRALEAE